MKLLVEESGKSFWLQSSNAPCILKNPKIIFIGFKKL
jgi:hypothetical protein